MMTTLMALIEDETGDCMHELAVGVVVLTGVAFAVLYAGANEWKNMFGDMYRFNAEQPLN